ncbi:thiamine pyrophosphate-dependent dehydrogenase E1 component subunit alpha [Azospirillum soli]|uniref:thiamine pyrophosphate-dependent dehydrogenase E1 component subunit alpha n=1 Tax=Azospirillum soli TaxID=1304799 RepID=UPI001FE64FC1|nr:thiamine pyrophosphate-dependent dehydrogenase E1 component subunit alpha [Azospirillum soli]MBP2316237.1 pyruvate dehydrogenase E1 component alpha subunit [Azospirillum soli]
MMDAQDDLVNLYRSLFLIRRVEERIAEIYHTDKIKSPVHLSIGQESVSVGVCAAMRPDDIAFGTYRGHALYLAKGGDLNAMISELYGKAAGCARGKAGSMHLVDMAVGMMPTSAIVATTIPQAVGYAMALKMRGSNQMVAVFFGDGSTEEGVFSESLNFAALKKLPILFVCENNLYAIYSSMKARWPADNLCDRVASYGIPAARIADGDLDAIRTAASAAVTAIRRGNGPQFLECMTYRWHDHVGPGEDLHIGYRTAEELAAWKAKDQVALTGARLAPDVRARVEQAVEDAIDAAFAFAEQDLFPDVAELHDHVFHQ